jgi:3D (Asp-Asp-Asp) domain-containing protein
LIGALILVPTPVAVDTACTAHAPAILNKQYKAPPEQTARKERPRTLLVEATAYTWTGNRTATGTWPRVGTIAVDPKVIPLGTKMYVEGYGYGVAEDTGSAIVGYKIDVYLPSRAEALKFGRRMVRITLLEG